MSTNTLTDAVYLFKSVYQDNELMEQFAENTTTRQIFKNTGSQWLSKLGAGQGNTSNSPAAWGLVWPIEDVRNNSVGAYSLSNPTLNPPTIRQGAQAYMSLMASSLGVVFDSILFTAANDDEKAFENVVKRNITTTNTDFENYESRVMWSNGNGVLGVVGAVNTGTGVITLTQSATQSFYPLTLFLSPNQYVTILSPTGADRTMDGILVSAISRTNGTITVPTGGGIGNVQAGDVIVGNQSWVAGQSAGQEPIGITGQFGNTNNLFNVNTTNHSSWVPASITTNNTDPTTSFVEQMRMGIVNGGAKPDCIITHPYVVSKYSLALETFKRYNDTTKIEGGVQSYDRAQKPEGPEYPGIGPMYADNNTPLGVQANTFCMYMGDTKSVFMGESDPIHWMDQDESMFKFIVGSASISNPSIAQYVGYLEHHWQFGCFRRISNALATNVNALLVA